MVALLTDDEAGRRAICVLGARPPHLKIDRPWLCLLIAAHLVTKASDTIRHAITLLAHTAWCAKGHLLQPNKPDVPVTRATGDTWEVVFDIVNRDIRDIVPGTQRLRAKRPLKF